MVPVPIFLIVLSDSIHSPVFKKWVKASCFCYFSLFAFQGRPVQNPSVFASFHPGRKGLGTYFAAFWCFFLGTPKSRFQDLSPGAPRGEVLEPGGSLGDPTGPPGEPLGAPLDTLETPLGPPWAHLSTFGEPLGSRWVPFGSLWDFL